MKSAAKKDGITLNISSAYRSDASQQKLWNNAVKKYGSEAKARKYVAKPGGSAHRTGKALDLVDSSGKAISYNSKASAWLIKNASKYGFNPYKAEAWHWEYNP